MELAESEDGLYMTLTGQLCYLDDYNANGIKLLKGERFDENLNSLVETPVVAKYVWSEDNGSDFSGHEAYRDWLTGEIRFGTEAIGVHQKVWVEDKMVKPVFSDTEKMLPVVMYQAKIWSDRFPNFANVIRKLYAQGNLGTSWELIPNAIKQEQSDITAIPNPRSSDDWTLIGNCLLGKDVIGAYEGTSKVTNIATATSVQSEIAQALKEDMDKLSENKKDGSVQMEERLKELESQLAEAVKKLSEYENANKDAEIASLKEELENLKSEKADIEAKFVSTTEKIESLTSEISELKEYKEKYDVIEAEKAEQEKIVKIAELKEMVVKGGFVKESELETSEELKTMLENCDENGLKIFRADRILASTEIAEVNSKKDKTEKRELSETNNMKKSFMDEFLSK